jgi:hypothetical protein
MFSSELKYRFCSKMINYKPSALGMIPKTERKSLTEGSLTIRKSRS